MKRFLIKMQTEVEIKAKSEKAALKQFDKKFLVKGFWLNSIEEVKHG